MHVHVRRRLGLLLIAGAVIGSGWGIYTLLREEPARPVPSKAEPSTEFSRPKLVGWSKGTRQWLVEARKMNDHQNTVTLEGIERGVIYKDNKEYFTFTAARGVWKKAGEQEGGGDLSLTGDVAVYKDNVQVFNTQELLWRGKEQTLEAPTTIHYSYEGSTATASRLTFNSTTEDAVLSGDVHLNLPDGIKVTIQGDLIYNLKTKAFHIKGTQEFEFST